MKKITTVLAITLALGLSTGVFAKSPAQGGFTGPGLSVVSVSDALKMSDDTPVVLEGRIEQSLGNEKYKFSDSTGTVTVEIDNKDWNGLVVGPNDLVQIHGEVDKSFTNFEIDVDYVIKNKK